MSTKLEINHFTQTIDGKDRETVVIFNPETRLHIAIEIEDDVPTCRAHVSPEGISYTLPMPRPVTIDPVKLETEPERLFQVHVSEIFERALESGSGLGEFLVKAAG